MTVLDIVLVLISGASAAYWLPTLPGTWMTLAAVFAALGFLKGLLLARQRALTQFWRQSADFWREQARMSEEHDPFG
jgi:hypothetical protein